jgi:DMSO/TMAO reductase YedYZ molybdopterin-dependent catalytic subunit
MIPQGHGAPLRARVETQLGYKSIKFLRRIVVTEKFESLDKLSGLGAGFSWFAGI